MTHLERILRRMPRSPFRAYARFGTSRMYYVRRCDSLTRSGVRINKLLRLRRRLA